MWHRAGEGCCLPKFSLLRRCSFKRVIFSRPRHETPTAAKTLTTTTTTTTTTTKPKPKRHAQPTSCPEPSHQALPHPVHHEYKVLGGLCLMRHVLRSRRNATPPTRLSKISPPNSTGAVWCGVEQRRRWEVRGSVVGLSAVFVCMSSLLSSARSARRYNNNRRSRVGYVKRKS